MIICVIYISTMYILGIKYFFSFINTKEHIFFITYNQKYWNYIEYSKIGKDLKKSITFCVKGVLLMI